MITEQVNDKLSKLPIAAQQEVLDFIDFLLQKSAHQTLGKKLNGEQKAKTIERWAKSHPLETSVILDDSRQIIYED